MKCPCCGKDRWVTIWFTICFTCEDWHAEIERRIAERYRRHYNTHRE